jgi:hypothetical protein
MTQAKLSDITLVGFVAFIKAQPETRKILRMDSGFKDDVFGDYTQSLLGSRTLCDEVWERLHNESVKLLVGDEKIFLLDRLGDHAVHGTFPTYGVLQMCFPTLFKE